MATDDLWIIAVLEELSVTEERFLEMVKHLPARDVEKFLKGKLTDVEKDKLIASLFRK